MRAINERAMYINCYGHVFNLVLVDSAKEVPFARNTLGIISELHITSSMLLQNDMLFLKVYRRTFDLS